MDDIYGYSPRAVSRDLALISLVAVVLVVIHVAVPPGGRARFAFNHDSLDPVTVVTSPFVHVDDAHLFGNLAGYVASTVVAYGLCLKARERRWFHLTFASFLVVLPATVSLTSYAILGWLYPAIDPITRGFSGVGAAFTGFVLIAVLVVVRTEYGWLTAQYLGLAVWLWLLLELFLIYGGDTLGVALAVAGLGWAFCGWGLIDEHGTTDIRDGLRRAADDVLTVGVVVWLLTLFVVVLFPAEPVGDGSVTNVFAHAAGMGYGLAGSGLTYRLLHR
ncbi:hypothetical protein ACFR9U_11665 [Halorientalis brevis]|uniref:Rhomboid family intramembrane serine protease n=1 Tax=Halorientalis brevis TaxID=1126241 RepID=A0ABD6CE46_9EURY|nr:hypothetical protein [Halorientalis brevis]